MSPRLAHKARVLRRVFPDCYQEVDGYWVYWPKGQGFLGAGDLRVIAELLDEANRKWDAVIQAEFA